MQYCSLQLLTLFPSPVTSTTGFCFHFGSISSSFLELFLHCSPVAYWAPTDLRVHLSVSYLFAFSHCSWGSQGKNTEMVCHSLLQWTTFCQNCYSFIELDNAVVHVIRLVSFLYLWFSVCLPSDGEG